MDDAKEIVSASRIFIGGLGANVTADDLEKTFFSLGRVANIDIVRSGGRDFAFMDFVPNSDKSLHKLFAMYNGCTWKGGKLRLEKAKETYLDRLKREWAEDAKDSIIVEPSDKKETYDSSKSVPINQEKKQLRILLPNSKKVKILPTKGSGKHKYSFQRIEILPRPIDFCGCDEHYRSLEVTTEKYFSTLNSLAFEKERSIMSAVMNKFLGKGDNDVLPSGTINLTTDAKYVDASNNEILVEEISDADDEDEDNFVTNIGMVKGDEMLMHLVGKGAQKMDQKPIIDKLQPPEDGMIPQNSKHPLKQKTALPVDSGMEGKTSKDRSDPTLTKNKCLKEIKEMQESRIEHRTSCDKAATRNSWIEKSSWRNLLGDSDDFMFSISNILPAIDSVETKVSKAKDSVFVPFSASKEKCQSNIEVFRSLQNELQVKESEVLDADPDNLVMNIVSGQSDAVAMQMIGRTTNSMDQVQQLNNNAPEPTQNELPLNEEHSKDHNIAAMVDRENTLTQTFSVTVAEKDSAEKNIITEALPDKQTVHTRTYKPATGALWIQKSAWRDLVSDSGNSSFSISNVIPETKLAEPKMPSVRDRVDMPSIAQKKRKSRDPEVSRPLEVDERMHVDMHGDIDEYEESKEHNDGDHQKTDDQEYRRSISKIEIGQVCTFMRSAESEKEWKKAKKALSGHLNKKTSDRNTSKESRGKKLNK